MDCSKLQYQSVYAIQNFYSKCNSLSLSDKRFSKQEWGYIFIINLRWNDILDYIPSSIILGFKS